MNGKKSASYNHENQSTLVAGKKRIRSTSVCVWLSQDEQAKIQERMADVGIHNLSAYMRKMALNGYVLHVDLTPVKKIVSLQRRCANNLNQIATQANTYGGVYSDEFKALQKDYPDLWRPLSELLEKLSEVECIRPGSASDGATDKGTFGHCVQIGAPQQAFSLCENRKCYILALLAGSALP